MTPSTSPSTHPPVVGFTGDFRFLSNFWEAPITLLSETWRTNEHAFQALKTLELHERMAVRDAPAPGRAKRLGRHVTLRPDWDEVRYDIMRLCVRAKFTQHAGLASRLLATGQAHLEEANTWGDRAWGTVDGVGTNWLGLILMEVRAELAALVPTTEPSGTRGASGT